MTKATAVSAFPAVRTLADVEAIERTPLAERLDADSTYEVLRRAAREHGARPALRFLAKGTPDEDAVVVTYTELLRRVTQTANLFAALGVERDDVVSYVLPNLPETHDTIWGAEAAGIVSAINPFLEPGTIRDLLDAARARLLVTLAPAPGFDLFEKVAAIADEVSSLQAILCVDPSRYLGAPARALPVATPGGTPILSFDMLRAEQPDDRLRGGRRIHPDDVAALFHTGGTTGTPKLARHTHGNQVFASWVMAGCLGVRPDDVMVVGLPLFHVNAVFAGGLALFQAGASGLLLTPLGFRTPSVTKNLWKLVARHRVTALNGVPTVYSALLSVPIGDAELGSLRYAGCGAAPLPADVARRFEESTGVEIVEGYGLTEGSCLSSLNPPDGEKRIGSIGLRVPYQEMICAAVDPVGETIRECKTNEVGRIAIRGPNVFAGYVDGAATAKMMLPGGWLDTGDLGRRDADGYFWLTGRSKDLIIRGGHNIDPAVIESALALHPSVALAAAVGQPDAHAGELPCAFVTLRANAECTRDELERFAKDHVSERAAAPVHVEILDEMPVTAVGKIVKGPLRRLASERVLRSALAEAGVQDAHVEVYDDTDRGLVARVSTTAPGAARDVLGRFAIACDLVPLHATK
ncbi:MAG TPA: acyl-CoA synthetase [Myxococcota bacterium]|nr:acyl-CoA synthetase [Myxococcota bacterium]